MECIIVEDSFVGKLAANASGCHVLPVRNPDDVALDRILNYITYINNGGDTKKLNIVIPMAGLGSRFANVGYKLPKPLIDVVGKPMIQVVVENLNINAHYIFVAMKEHVDKYDIEKTVKEITGDNYTIVTIDGLTEGSACTVLTARDIINNDNPMMLINSDQYLEWDAYEFLVAAQGVDGLISVFEADHPKWSYAKTDDNGYVTEVAEKKVISNLATTGLYYFAKGSQFVRCADTMIAKNIRTNNEFYNCPIYNEAILEGAVVKTHMCAKMWGIGTPEDLEVFLEHHDKW
jgi:dTDP-glucose pyrophosphorylase